MKKRISVFLFLSVFLLTFCLTGFSKKVESQLNIKSKSAYLLDYKTNSVIYSYNETKRLPIASVTKVMTLALCFDALKDGIFNLDDKIIVSENASSMGGSQIFLEKDGEYLISDIIKGIVVCSANDGCVAMAELIAGSEDNFVTLMNNKANELQMNNTLFVNCTGLPKPGQYSCAKDVVTMFSYLLKHDEYFNFSTIWIDKISHPNDRYTEISNTNKLIRFYQGCDAGKTGFTQEAGHCLVASACKNNMRLISCVISAPDSKTRFNEVSSLFNYGFNNYESRKILDCSKPLTFKADVKGGKAKTINLSIDKDVYIFTEKNKKCSFDFDFNLDKSIKAPIVKNQVLGELNIYEKGVLIDTVKIVSMQDLESKSYLDCIIEAFYNWSLL